MVPDDILKFSLSTIREFDYDIINVILLNNINIITSIINKSNDNNSNYCICKNNSIYFLILK